MTAEEFRHVLGHLATGVTVITGAGPRGPVGMAANSVTSVSLEPPLVLFCPSRASETWPELRSTGRFTINVMADGHEELTRRFAAKGVDRFDGLTMDREPIAPRIHNALAWVECAVRDEHEAGDHTIVVADVLGIAAAGQPQIKPLVFFRGRYGSFAG